METPKKACSEIKNFANPPQAISETAQALANFVENKDDATWNSSKAKIFDYINRGVGLRGERVSEH